MRGATTADDVDRALLNVLQVAPRASWRTVGDVLGISPVTAARRWEQLSGAGLAWTAVCGSARLLGRTSLAVVAVSAGAGQVARIAHALVDDPCVVDVAHTTGDCDLLLTVWTPDLAAFTRYLVGRLHPLVDGAEVRVSYASRVHADGSRWRLRALDGRQRRDLRPAHAATAVFHAEDRDLVVALSHNARATYEELAARVGTSPATARRRLRRLLGEGSYLLRCEVSRATSGFPVEVALWLSAPPEEVDAAAARLAGLPQTRLCATVVDTSNLLLVARLRALDDLHPLEADLARTAPRTRVTRRALTLRPLKQANHVLADDRATHVVPADIWAVAEQDYQLW